jgi:hypothetical protein
MSAYLALPWRHGASREPRLQGLAQFAPARGVVCGVAAAIDGICLWPDAICHHTAVLLLHRAASRRVAEHAAGCLRRCADPTDWLVSEETT